VRRGPFCLCEMYAYEHIYILVSCNIYACIKLWSFPSILGCDYTVRVGGVQIIQTVWNIA
jgi:hypothetical protein